MTKRKLGIRILGLVLLMFLVNILAKEFQTRLDFTVDQRYTLSPVAEEFVSEIESPVYIQVLLGGALPPEFRKLAYEAEQLLEEIQAENPSVDFDFVDPIEGLNEQEIDQLTKRLASQGIVPAIANVQESGKNTRLLVFPYLVAERGGKKVIIPLMDSTSGETSEERVTSSVQQLEYNITDALRQLVSKRNKKIAIMRDSGELPDANISSLVGELQKYYRVAPFGIETVQYADTITELKVLQDLRQYDLVVEAKPTKALTERKKYILDQYLMGGGNLMLMLDPYIFDNDSLMNKDAKGYAVKRELNLDDQLFKYGLRLNAGVVKDERCGAIALASGYGRNQQFEAFEWPYYPVAKGNQEHIITANASDVRFEYTGSIEVLGSASNPTVLLESSSSSAIKPLPAVISLSEIDKDFDPLATAAPKLPLAMMISGKLGSAYKNRIKPFKNPQHLDEAVSDVQLFLSADGDLPKNEVSQGRPLEMGYDLRTGVKYGNEAFITNVVNFLMGDQQILELRNKKIAIALLDQERAYENRAIWQLFNTVVPLALIVLLGLVFNWVRRRRFT